MKLVRQFYFIITILLFIECSTSNPPDEHYIYTTRYKQVKDWPKLPKGFKLGNPTGVGVNSQGNLIVFHRADRTWPLLGSMSNDLIQSETILKLDTKSGSLLDAWGANLFIMPHGLAVDDKDNIWVTDVGLHQVFKFDSKGKLLLKLGEAGIAGNDTNHFNQPTDVAIAKDGSFYVSDGYGNSRITQFSAKGTFILQWGAKGNQDGEFNIPHAITLDQKGYIYVADRENSRIQVFNQDGKFIEKRTQQNFGKITSVYFDSKYNRLVATDDHNSWFGLKHNGSDLIVFDTLGKVVNKFAKEELSKHKQKAWYHDLVVDDEGSIYVGDILGNTIQKFKKVSN